MMGINHTITGAVVYLGADLSLGSGGTAPHLLNCLGAAALGSLAPDLDTPKSSLGRRFLPVSWTLSALIGHRGFSHSLLACLAVAATAFLLGTSYPPWLAYGLAFALGYATHILGDWLTTEGVPLFWPNRRRYRSPLNFRTGGLGEYVFGLAAGGLLGFWLYRLF